MEVASNNKSNAFSLSPPSSLLSDFFYISLLSSRMKTPNSISPMVVSKSGRFFLCCFLPTAILVSAAFFMGNLLVVTDYKERLSGWISIGAMQITGAKVCQAQCRPDESESLPRGIVSRTSDLEMRSLQGAPIRKKNSKTSTNLLAVAAGIKQKESVNKIVTKFLSSDFVLMLFHYDGIVDDWRDFEWSSQAIHVSAMNQTKWWFAKRFLHPDIISEYAYIFIWDEDIGVEYFDVGRYLSIIKEEELEISQPALDPYNSVVHHPLTLREKTLKVHRKTHRREGARRCDGDNTGPPCAGWVEIMVPVFSKAAWRCTWLLIQSDLIHGWGVDEQLGYCVKGNRTKNIGIVDSEYVVHNALPTLGGSPENQTNPQLPDQAAQNTSLPNSELLVPSVSTQHDDRDKVRKRCFAELAIFRKRWNKSVEEDECWVDPYKQPPRQSNY
ncbi:uncharacterized protein LOC117919364 isoform X1 [Vitis riparia]|uniref:uncharacterized protein LOC117919364 isoform X1 n=1 Tax=Vitis riparia TaxID=96939 RepID=UPI00155ADF38|nr:uncharacterized protein LOC117919364 isoform X1 [Vitis riparia]